MANNNEAERVQKAAELTGLPSDVLIDLMRRQRSYDSPEKPSRSEFQSDQSVDTISGSRFPESQATSPRNHPRISHSPLQQDLSAEHAITLVSSRKNNPSTSSDFGELAVFSNFDLSSYPSIYEVNGIQGLPGGFVENDGYSLMGEDTTSSSHDLNGVSLNQSRLFAVMGTGSSLQFLNPNIATSNGDTSLAFLDEFPSFMPPSQQYPGLTNTAFHGSLGSSGESTASTLASQHLEAPRLQLQSLAHPPMSPANSANRLLASLNSAFKTSHNTTNYVSNSSGVPSITRSTDCIAEPPLLTAGSWGMSYDEVVAASHISEHPVTGIQSTALVPVLSRAPTPSRPLQTDDAVIKSVTSILPTLAPKSRLQQTNKEKSSSSDRSMSSKIMSTPIKKRRRAPYSEQRRFETGRTRKMMSCIRCHTQRIRCEMNPGGDHLPCVKCSNFTPRIFFLGCLRYKITDSVLFRTSFGPYTFYKNHPVVGPDYGDFSLQKTRSWVGEEVHVLETTQDMGSVCRIEVRQFEPPEEIDAVDVKGRSMYYIPWAIADEDQATLAVNNFLDECMVPYLNSLLDEGDELVWEVFASAIRFGYVLRKQSVVRDVLRLWVACRFMEGKWRCCGQDTLGAGELKNPFRSADWVSPPPYIDYQSGSITAERILSPLRVSVLRTLQDLVEEKKPENWYTTFLVTFILLHNYERGVAFQRAFWAKRKTKLLYLDMPLIRGIHSGAKAILAYFHWSCKGNIPFAADFNWNSKKAQSMANIDAEQGSFMVRLGNLARQKADEMENISRSDNYDTPYWFTSQIFEGRWSPRDTLEHSPPAQPLTPAAVYGPAAPLLAS